MAIQLPKWRVRDDKVEMTSIDKVLVWIFQDTQVLLLKTVAARGAQWQPITGWVDAGESADAAARREVSEETGIALAAVPIQLLGDPVSFLNRGRQVREQAFIAKLERGTREIHEIQIDPSEHTEWKWVDAESALRELPFPQQQASLSAALLLTLEPARKD